MAPCKFFAKGSCAKGLFCRFDHDVNLNPLTPDFVPSTVPTRLATVGLEDRVNALAITPQDNRLTIPCKFFPRGQCNKGDGCPFAHASEAATVEEFPAQKDAADEVMVDNFTRELFGTISTFQDGGQISKISLPSDYSAVRINGLPPATTAESVAVMLGELDSEVPVSCVRTIGHADTLSVSADVRVENPHFASRFCINLETNKSINEAYSNLQAIPVAANIFSASTANRIDCQRVSCSWYKPSCTAWLNFGTEKLAQKVSDRINNGSYKIRRKEYSCTSPTRSGGRSRNPVAWTVTVNGLPTDTWEEDIMSAIKDEWNKPRHVELGKPNYKASTQDTCNAVRSLLSEIGPLELWSTTEAGSGKRIKAKARFKDEADARSAITRLNGTSQSTLGNGKLWVQLLISSKFKVTTDIYDALRYKIDEENRAWGQQHVNLNAYRNTDPAQKYTVLKLEGSVVKDVAKAKDSMETILAGTVAMDGDVPLWHSSFSHGAILQTMREIRQDLGVVVVRDKRKSRIQLYGALEKCKEAERILKAIAETATSAVYVIDLPLNKFWWAIKGGFQSIAFTLGPGVATIDTVSTPKRILITGSKQDYDTALALLDGQLVIPGHAQAQREKEGDERNEGDKSCTVCWTEAENPIRTKCNHLYCLECFADMCTAAASQDEEFGISCPGNMGKCDVLFSLPELQDYLSSNAFEELLEASFASYIRRRPHVFRYCPTPDCGHIYRVESSVKIRTCLKCLSPICTSCHISHDGMTCAEYKDIMSGGHEAFERLKKERGFKDCPKCGTTMEKTDGCNHMVCSGCRTHICWVCLETFRESGACYKHMNKAHGSIGLDALLF